MTTGLQLALHQRRPARPRPGPAGGAADAGRARPRRGARPTHARPGPGERPRPGHHGRGKERIGVWAIKALPPALWVRTPTRELALLRIPLARFYGDKIVFALLGLLIPPLLAFFFDASVSASPSLSPRWPRSVWPW